MVCNIVTSPIMLRMPSVPATPEDIVIGRDLADTLSAHSHECVGLAANMIGKRKCVIAVTDGPRTLVMFNPALSSGTTNIRPRRPASRSKARALARAIAASA